MDPIPGILVGAIGGVGWAIIGFVKTRSTPDKKTVEPFDPKKLIKTAIIGAAVGGYIGYSGQEFSLDLVSTLSESAMFVPVAGVAEKITGLIWNVLVQSKRKVTG